MKKLQAYNHDGALCLALDAPPGDPPGSFVILAAGTTDTSKGAILFDQEAASSVVSAFSDHGQGQLPVDYEHGMLGLISTPESGSAAGWFTPSVNVGGDLVANDVQWTPRAAQKLREREYRYFSPALHVDPDTGRVAKLVNVALTNLPATKDQVPLVANQKNTAPGTNGQEQDEMKNLLKLLGADNEAEAMTVATEWNKTGQELLTLTGTKTLTEALVAIEANAKLPTEVAKLSAAIAERDKADAGRDRDALIVTLSEAGKLPPALHDWARTQTLDSLQAFGESAPEMAGGENHDPPEGGVKTVSLSDEDRKVMKQMGVSKEDFLKVRADEGKAS